MRLRDEPRTAIAPSRAAASAESAADRRDRSAASVVVRIVCRNGTAPVGHLNALGAREGPSGDFFGFQRTQRDTNHTVTSLAAPRGPDAIVPRRAANCHFARAGAAAQSLGRGALAPLAFGRLWPALRSGPLFSWPDHTTTNLHKLHWWLQRRQEAPRQKRVSIPCRR